MRILVIEDNKALAEQLCGWLQEKDNKTISAHNEQEAEDILSTKGNTIQVAIVDMFLPPKENGLNYRESGLRLIKLMNNKYPYIDSIVNTDYAEFENSLQCMEAGAFSYINKGDDPNRLLNVIQRAQEKQRKNQQMANAVNNLSLDVDKAVGLLHDIMGALGRIQDEFRKDTTIDG
jgi:DNA-binding NtrC family response regulator